MRTAKLQNAFDKRCEQVSYSGIQEKILENRGTRNLKLYNSYKNEWTEMEEKALDKLAKSFSKKPSKQKRFAETRVSVLEHSQKLRSKKELNDIVDLLQDHSSANFWESGLRKNIKANDRKEEPPKTVKQIDNLFSMQQNTKFTKLGHRNDLRQIHSTEVTKVPQSVNFIRSGSV